MYTFRKLKDANGMAKARLKKIQTTGRYYSMEKSNPDKTAFKRPPYYMTVGRGITHEEEKTASNA